MRIVNKKALHNYFILEKLEAGIVLTGAEVKSIKQGRVELGESFIRILGHEAYLLNANIPKLQQVSTQGYEITRSRKLLLHRDQINSLIRNVSRGGITLVPVSLYDKKGRIKVEVGLAKAKRQIDKRKLLKERDHRRRIEQELKGKE